MSNNEKELAFLRDLYIQDDWTRRFTELVDKHLDLSDSENLAYLNAGTGGHAMDLSDKYGEQTDVFASCENGELLQIAMQKAAAISSRADMSSITFESDSFDAVLADASFVTPGEFATAIDEAARIARAGGDVGVFLPSRGSFGEVFSLLWELLETTDDSSMLGHAERLISELPTTTEIERAGQEAGLVNVRTDTAAEIFEYENGEELARSPLFRHFLLPSWFANSTSDELDAIAARTATLIDDESQGVPFRFTVKATLLSGEKS